MRILIATDAWHPQVNGVVRTLTSLARSAANLDGEISFLTPDGFPSIGVPTYPGLRVALPSRAKVCAISWTSFWSSLPGGPTAIRKVTGRNK